MARDKEERPYQRFPSSTANKPPTISVVAAHTDTTPAPFTESLKPLEECYTIPATTPEDWKAIDAFISQNQNNLAAEAAAAMNMKEAVEEEARTPLTKEDIALINNLPKPDELSAPPILTTSPGSRAIPKAANLHTAKPSLNRKFSSSVKNNWAAINTWIREAATQAAMKRRLGLSKDISAALATLTREELTDLATALNQPSPTPPLTTEEPAAILDLPPPPPIPPKPTPKNIHTVNPTLDGQFSTSETTKLGKMTIKVLEDGSRTENRLSSVLITLPPGTRGPPMKANEGYDEGFLVVKGKVRFRTTRYLDVDLKKSKEKIKDVAAENELKDEINTVVDVGATSTAGDLLVPNKDMLEEILHAGARPVAVDHIMSAPEMENEGISVDVDVKWGGWVTVPKGARYTFSNPFEEEAEMLNTFTPGGDSESMRRMSDEGRGEAEMKDIKAAIATKRVDDGGS